MLRHIRIRHPKPGTRPGALVEHADTGDALTIHALSLDAGQPTREHTAATLDERIGLLVGKLDMGRFLDQRNETLSSGMRQKVSIARALIHDPEILLFDELTTGLDVAAAESVLTVVAACKREGRTVLFSTHHMDEVDQLCDSVVIIHEGKLCFEGGVDAMRSQTGESFLDKAFLRLIRPKTEGAAT